MARFRFSSRDVSRFNASERNRWIKGRWHHGYHNNRFGWWWFLNGGWFFYDQPIYPYPAYVSSDAYYDDDTFDSDDYGYEVDGDGSGMPPNDSYLYYCSDPQGYYPDVRQCLTDWRRVSPSSAGPQGYNDDSAGPDDLDAPYDDGPQGDEDN